MTGNKIDYLSALPNELLDDIFGRVRRPLPLVGTLNKRLLPFLLKNLYREIRISTWRKLELFCQLSTQKPELASYVKELDLWLTMDSFRGLLTSDCFEDPHLELKDQVVAFFHRLSHLKVLRINGTSWVARLPFEISDSNKFPFSSTLTILDIETTFDDKERRGERPNLWSLFHYPRLSQFIVDMQIRGEYSDDDETEIEREPPTLLPNLAYISILAPLSKLHALGPFINSARSLHSLNLTDPFNPDSTLLKLVGRVRKPSTLGQLCLCTEHEPFIDTVSPRLLEPLESFTKLRTIEVGFPPIHGLSRVLSKLPVKSLTWDCLEGVTTDDLRNVLVGPNRVGTLERLRVYGVYGEGIGKSLAGVDWKEDIDPEEHGWDLPGWTDDFSREGVEGVVELAESVGVAIDGGAVDALEVEDEWEQELAAFNARRPIDQN
ncbi:hypothetical protein JCM5350_003786 [Sporobolomyces pararoseus]